MVRDIILVDLIDGLREMIHSMQNLPCSDLEWLRCIADNVLIGIHLRRILGGTLPGCVFMDMPAKLTWYPSESAQRRLIDVANTKLLRRRIEQQIKALQEKLKAIEVVEQLAQEHGHGNDREHSASESATEEGIAETIQDTAARVLADDWMSIQDYYQAVQKQHPGVRLAAVSTAMRRLTLRGVAEVRGSRKEGLEYRRRPPQLVVQGEPKKE